MLKSTKNKCVIPGQQLICSTLAFFSQEIKFVRKPSHIIMHDYFRLSTDTHIIMYDYFRLSADNKYSNYVKHLNNE